MPEHLLKKQSGEQGKRFEGRFDLLVLANAKKMNMCFDELALFYFRDFLEFTDIYFGEFAPSNEQHDVRDATQADIDRLLG